MAPTNNHLRRDQGRWELHREMRSLLHEGTQFFTKKHRQADRKQSIRHRFSGSRNSTLRLEMCLRRALLAFLQRVSYLGTPYRHRLPLLEALCHSVPVEVVHLRVLISTVLDYDMDSEVLVRKFALIMGRAGREYRSWCALQLLRTEICPMTNQQIRYLEVLTALGIDVLEKNGQDDAYGSGSESYPFAGSPQKTEHFYFGINNFEKDAINDNKEESPGEKYNDRLLTPFSVNPTKADGDTSAASQS
ncbi:hypothetical protein GGR56DRAFT_671593 [Xylariaceae sp. FL0804]|nr:hypothetical protein GGR56DRAFT_671593 [Xylariaceae sp. FL0804]